MRTYYPYAAATALVLTVLACAPPNCQARSYWGGDENDAAVLPVRSMMKRSSPRIRVCGVQLVQMIRLVCKGVEARAGRRKREAGYIIPQEYLHHQDTASRNGIAEGSFGSDEVGWMSLQEEDDNDSNSWEPTHRAVPDRFNTVSAVQSVVKRGAAERCCASACTMAHLETYC